MSLTIATIKPMECFKYEQIPNCYAEFPPELCEICCAWEDADRQELLGAVIAVPLAMETDRAAIRFLWLRDEIGRGEIFLRILLQLRDGLRSKGISRMLYWHLRFDGEEDGILTEKKLKELGFYAQKQKFYSCAYYVEDFFDTSFVERMITLAVKDTHVHRFREYSANKCWQLLQKLEEAEGEVFYGLSLESPFSRFCMEGNTPLGAMTVEQPELETIVIGGVSLRNITHKKQVFSALLAGVLSAALESRGLDCRLIARFKSEEERDLLERLLGLSEIPVEYKPYIFNIR